MTTLTEKQQLPFTDEGFQSFLESRVEPEWLTEIRKTAWQRFNEMPWPSSKDEEWMRTDIRIFDLAKFYLPAAAASQELPEAVLSEGVELAGSAATRDGGSTRTPELDSKWSDKGVVLGTSVICLPNMAI